MTTALIAVFLVALLIAEWRYRRKILRGLAIGASLVTLFFAQPGYYRAVRVALSTPASDRVVRLGDRRATESESGVMTMDQAVLADADLGANARRVSLGVLVWLALTPLFRDRRRAGRLQAAEPPPL